MDIKRQPDDNIFIIDNVITNELCDKIIEQIEITKKVRCDLSDPINNVICEAMDVAHIKDEKIRNKIDFEIYKVIDTMIKLLSWYGIPCSGDSGYILRKITGPTRIHIDGTAIDPVRPSINFRVMSIIIALNDDYEGGEFLFVQHKRKIKLKKGQLIGFPSSWTHPHGTNPLKNGTVRYTVTTWITHQ